MIVGELFEGPPLQRTDDEGWYQGGIARPDAATPLQPTPLGKLPCPGEHPEREGDELVDRVRRHVAPVIGAARTVERLGGEAVP